MKKYSIDEILTITEASELYKGVKGTSEANIRYAFRTGRFDKQLAEGSARKAPGGWLISKEAMYEVFGEPLKGGE